MDGDFKELIEFLDKKFDKIEKDISDFKDSTMRFEDRALKDLEDLKREKTVGDEQNKRKTKVLEIHNDALKSGKILSEKQSAEIDALHAF